MTARIVVVCTGNICRSAMAEVVLRDRIEADGLDIEVTSAGTSDEERGGPIDPRAVSVLVEHGYHVPRHHARQVMRDDLGADLILAMTRGHKRTLLAFGADPARTHLWTEFVAGAGPDVADPWYGGRRDFEETLEIIEAGIDGVLAACR
ncbi:MAG: low molecular weight protein-tyrosine-phosphatase [Microbacterium sp.]